MTINLNKNQTIDLKKDDGHSVKRVFVGINWNQNTYSGEEDFDLDLLGCLTNESGKISDIEYLVNWLTYKQGIQWTFAKFYGDNQTGDDSQGVEFNGLHFDEGMELYTENIPASMCDFYVASYIHLGMDRMQNFGMIPNASMDIYDMDDPEGFHLHYDFSRDKKFESLAATVIGKFYRQSDGTFAFRAIGAGFEGGAVELYKHFGLDVRGC